ncbi:MAG: HAD-IIIA family hydrolase [Candidatus Aceula meridiana]|nr:HAD-IIIA family hydrolase [Candidatus Aceula meridiana]
MKIAFLDRDGVINAFPGFGNYVTKVKDFHFLPGAIDSIVELTKEGYSIFVVSNQAGVGKGLYSKGKLETINVHMLRHITKAGGRIKKTFYCTHRSDAGCDCRKPRTGSVEKALKGMNKTIDHAKYAYFVGDDKTDIEAGINAGCKTILVLSGKNRSKDIKSWDITPDYVVKSLKEATKIIIHENSHHPRNSR